MRHDPTFPWLARKSRQLTSGLLAGSRAIVDASQQFGQEFLEHPGQAYGDYLRGGVQGARNLARFMPGDSALEQGIIGEGQIPDSMHGRLGGLLGDMAPDLINADAIPAIPRAREAWQQGHPIGAALETTAMLPIIGGGMIGAIRRVGEGAGDAARRSRGELQAIVKAKGLPATGTNERLENVVRVIETDPSEWTRADFELVGPYLKVHQDLNRAGIDNSATIMERGIDHGMVDALDRSGNIGQYAWASQYRGGEPGAYLLWPGDVKYKSATNPYMAPGNIPFAHIKPEPGTNDTFEALQRGLLRTGDDIADAGGGLLRSTDVPTGAVAEADEVMGRAFGDVAPLGDYTVDMVAGAADEGYVFTRYVGDEAAPQFGDVTVIRESDGVPLAGFDRNGDRWAYVNGEQLPLASVRNEAARGDVASSDLLSEIGRITELVGGDDQRIAGAGGGLLRTGDDIADALPMDEASRLGQALQGANARVPTGPSGAIDAPDLPWTERFADSWDERGVESWLTEADDHITLHQVVVPEGQRGQGVGTEFMDELTAYADEAGKPLLLTPSTDFGGSSKGRLTDFYRRFGFSQNSGSVRDYALPNESMRREPQGLLRR